MKIASLNDIKKRAMPILKKEGVIRAALFGSYVRGEEKKSSDIDILVDLPRGKSLFDFTDLQIKLEQVLGKKVDLGEFSTIKPRLKEYILKEAVRII